MTLAYKQAAFTPDGRLVEAERSLMEQRAYVGRLIVCGGPTQAAEDRLRQLERDLARLRASSIGRTLEGSHD
jgi:hypothetical protein